MGYLFIFIKFIYLIYLENDSVLYVFIILSFSHLINNKTVFSFI